MPAKNTLQRSRGKFLRGAPKKLDWLIWLANQSPPDFELPDLDVEMGAEAKMLLVEGKYREYQEKELETVRVIMKKLPESLNDFIMGDVDFMLATSSETFNSFADRYRLFQSLRKNLLKIVGMAKYWGSPAMSFVAWAFPMRLEGVAVVLKPDGKGLRSVSNPLVEALTDPNVEITRIRQCDVCQCFFWAGRIDAKHCGAVKCKSTLSSRLYRERKGSANEKGTYLYARKKRRQRASEIKQTTQSSTKKGK
ncbi:MAG: hypothetical protein M3458_18100 [Acidobacteriota bacterium]|nr:hypothetical protein [Acidobacteriota bacterium]